jgi:hypothetical protein
MIYAVMKDGQCVAKIVWDGQTRFTYPFPHDELVADPENQIPMIQIETEEQNEEVI